MDLVIFTMRSDKSNKYRFRRIIDFDNQSIFIASNIEYDSVAAQKNLRSYIHSLYPPGTSIEHS
jgi:hypothetical protein